MSGVGFLSSVKTIGPDIRRRRHCEKHNLELYRDQPDVVPCWDAVTAPPITPPAAFLPPGHKRLSKKGILFIANVIVRRRHAYDKDLQRKCLIIQSIFLTISPLEI